MSKRNLMIAAVCAVMVACGGTETGGTTVPVEDASASTTEAPPTSTTEAPSTTSTSTTTSSSTTAPTATTEAGSGSTGDFAQIQAALVKSAEAVPGRIEGSVSIRGLDPSTGGGDFEMPMSMAFDSETGNSSFLMDLSGIAQASGEELPPGMADMFGEFELRQVGDVAYVKFPFFNMFLGAETPWISMPAEEGSSFAEDFSSGAMSDPTAFLDSLDDTEGTVENLGQEEIRGIETTHYRVMYDAEQWLSEMTPEERAELEADGFASVAELPVELWIGADGVIHRYLMSVDGNQAADVPPEEQFESMAMQFDFFDFGANLTIEPPPADQVTDMEDLENSFATVPSS